MCVPAAMGLAGPLMEQLGDPLGTKARRDEQQQSKWAREDAIRDATFAHEKEMAGIQYGGSNRSQLGTGKVGRAPGSGTVGGQGGSKSRYSSGTSQSGSSNRAS